MQRKSFSVLVLTLGMTFATHSSASPINEHSHCVVDGHLFCFDLTSRPTLLWQHDKSTFTRRPVQSRERVVTATGSSLMAYDNRGKLSWRTELAGTFRPALNGNRLYATTLHGIVARFNAESGAPLWRRKYSGWIYPPAVFADLIVTGGQAGVLTALRASDGAQLWQRKLSQELVYRPVASGANRFLVTSFDGAIEMYDIEGHRSWRREFSVPATSPVIHKDLVYAPLLDRRVIVLRTNNGELLWQRTFDTTQQLRRVHGQVFGFNDDEVTRIERNATIRWRTHEGSVLDITEASNNRVAAIIRHPRQSPTVTILSTQSLEVDDN